MSFEELPSDRHVGVEVRQINVRLAPVPAIRPRAIVAEDGAGRFVLVENLGHRHVKAVSRQERCGPSNGPRRPWLQLRPQLTKPSVKSRLSLMSFSLPKLRYRRKFQSER